MGLFTEKILNELKENGRRQRRGMGTRREIDHVPVVKLFTPDASATWLLTEIDPDNPDVAFGLCDLGLGFPELGYVSISEIESTRGPFGLPIERDLGFHAKKVLSAYAAEARQFGHIRS